MRVLQAIWQWKSGSYMLQVLFWLNSSKRRVVCTGDTKQISPKVLFKQLNEVRQVVWLLHFPLNKGLSQALHQNLDPQLINYCWVLFCSPRQNRIPPSALAHFPPNLLSNDILGKMPKEKILLSMSLWAVTMKMISDGGNPSWHNTW